MRGLATASVVLLAFGVAGCGNSDKGGTTPTPSPTTGAIKGVATLGGATSGNAGIVVGVLGGGAAITDDAGNYAIADVNPGSFTLQAQYPGYKSASTSVSVTAGQVTSASQLDLQAIKIVPKGGVSGHVFLFDTPNAAGSTVTLSSMAGMATTAGDGSYSIATVPAGTYDATFAHNGYMTQTVHSVTVGESGSVTIPDVTLRRATTTINGHTITPISTSPDWSQQLIAIDGVLQVVAEADGSGSVVGRGTTAANGVISADHRHVAINDNNQMLWLDTIGGSGASLLSAHWAGNAFFSPDGTHLVFNINNVSTGNQDYYVVASTGGTPALLAASIDNFIVTPDLSGAVITLNQHNDGQGLSLEDLVTVKTNSGAAHTTTDVDTQDMQFLQNQNQTSFALLFATSTGVNGTTSTGDLYFWNSSSETPKQLSGGTSPLALVNTQLNTFYLPFFWDQYAYVGANNFDSDGTFNVCAVNVADGTLTEIVARNQTPFPFNGVFYGSSSFFLPPNTMLATDQHDDAGVYTYDLYNVDLSKGQRTLLQANAAKLFGGAPAAGDPASLYVREMADVFGNSDNLHWAFGNTLDTGANTANFVLFDGTQSHKLTSAPIGLDVLNNIRFSPSFRVAAYASTAPTGPTPLTILNLPASGTAGDGVSVPLAASPQPGTQWTMSSDGSTVAWLGLDDSVVPNVVRLYKVPTAASSSPVTPAAVITDPTAGNSLAWFGVSSDGSVAFAGDLQAGVNAWAVGSSGTLVPLDANGLGGNPPNVLTLTGGRTLVTNESGGNFIAQIDKGATPTVTTLANYVTGNAWINGAHTRAFYSTSTPTLEWVTGTANGSTAGAWRPAGLPFGITDSAAMYFHDGGGAFGGHLTAYDGATGVVPLALDNAISMSALIPTFSHFIIVDQDANNVNHLVVTPKSAPARLVLSDGYPTANTNVSGGPNVNTLFGFSSIFTQAPVTLYAPVDANAGTGNPPSWGINAVSLGTNTVVPVASNVDPSHMHFDGSGTHLLVQTIADPLLGTFSLYTSSTATGASTKVSDNVLSVFASPQKNNLFGWTLTQEQGGVFSALAGQAGVALTSAAVSSNSQPFWSGDESHVVAIDTGAGQTGPAYAGAVGAAGTEIDTYAALALPDMTGGNVLVIAQPPTAPGLVIDHATVQ